MGEVDETIEVMKKGRKEKPHVQKLYRFTYDDSDAPAMVYMGKQIRKCSPSTTTIPVNKPMIIRNKKNVSMESPIKKVKAPVVKTRYGRLTRPPIKFN